MTNRLTDHDLRLRTNGHPPIVRWPIQAVRTPVAPHHTWPERLLLVACLLIAVAFLFVFVLALILGFRELFHMVSGGRV